MPIKIQDGTPKSGKSLCTSCKFCRTVKGQNCEVVMTCAAVMFGGSMQPSMVTVGQGWQRVSPNQIRFKVEECSSYADINAASLDEMKKIAWDVHPRKRGSAGFGDGVTNANELEMIITPPDTKKQEPATWKAAQTKLND